LLETKHYKIGRFPKITFPTERQVLCELTLCGSLYVDYEGVDILEVESRVVVSWRQWTVAGRGMGKV
jgi:hypothetical protein